MTEEFFDETMFKFLECFELNQHSKKPVINAIKISALIDFDLLKKLNLLEQNIEDVFNLAVEETKQRFEYDFATSEEGIDSKLSNSAVKISFF